MRNRLLENYTDTDKETRGFSPTPQWMREKYDMLNQELFDGILGECEFNIFTKGRGAEGNVLGKFYLDGTNLRIERSSRRIFQTGYNMWGDVTLFYCDRKNFVTMCKPTISLNGNYTGTEYGFLSTLIHEMCHYFTYMNGFVPKQGHGPEFYRIAQHIEIKSNKYFTVDRLASDEDITHFDLNDKMKAKQEKRQATKKASTYAIFDYDINGNTFLTLTNSKKLIEEITSFIRNPYSTHVIITNDSNVLDALSEDGYTHVCRTWKYWNVTNKPFLSLVDSADKKIFNNPKFKDSNIVNETIHKVVSETISQMLGDTTDYNDSLEITPDMNLGLYSPIEL